MPTLQWTVSRGRILLAAFLALVCAGALLTRLVAIQVFAHERFEARAEQNQEGRVLLPPRRGDIVDRHGSLLASDVSSYSVHAVPRLMRDPAATARRLASVLSLEPDKLRREFAKRPHFAWVSRRVEPEQLASVQKLGLPGVFWNHVARREYPGGSSCQQVTGKVNLDGHGVEGIEHKYDEDLAGESGWATYIRDGAGGQVMLPRSPRRDPSHGLRLVLTIDAEVQGAVMSRLEEAVRETGARQAAAVLLDPHSGEIWSFGAAGPAAEGARRQPVVSDTYEPGSTFKLVVTAAALEEEVAATSSVFHAGNGSYDFGKFSIRDVHGYGDLTLFDAFRYSSNVVAGKLALLVGRERYYRYATLFGFGSLTGVDFPGEIGGKLRPPHQWSERSLPTLAIGQELTVTPLQLAAAYGAVANGGWLVKPHLVKAKVDPAGDDVRDVKARTVQRVLSEQTAATLRSMLRAVVDSGTAKKAGLPWAPVGGKTGTAEKYDPAVRTYSASKYISSFVGIVPAEEPKLVCLVLVDEPTRGHYGGEVAAPVFRRILEDIRRIPEGPLSPKLARVQVRPSEFRAPPSEVPEVRFMPTDRARAVLAESGFRVRVEGRGTHVYDQKPAAGERLGRGEWVEIALEPAGDGIFPSVMGLTLREAINRLGKVGVNPIVEGSGVVVEQNPPPGSVIERAQTCLLRARPSSDAAVAQAPGGRRGD